MNKAMNRMMIGMVVLAVVLSLFVANIHAQCSVSSLPRFAAGQIFSFFIVTTPITADFDRDGFPDLAGPRTPFDQVLVGLNDHKGGLRLITTLITGGSPVAVRSGDFNRDGKLDIVVSHTSSNFVSVFAGNGDGTFTSLPNINTTGNFSRVGVGDFNNDGKLDLILGVGGSSISYAIATGDGQGGFSLATSVSIAGNAISDIVVNDLNRDGKQDVALVRKDGVLSVLLNNGSGAFGSPTTFTFGPNTTLENYQARQFDSNRDGKLDLAFAAELTGQVFVVPILLGNGTGGFGAVTNLTIPNGRFVLSVQLGDINGDGLTDIIAESRPPAATGDFLDVYYQLNGGSFDHVETALGTLVPQPSETLSIAAGDFDKDGKDDIAIMPFSFNGAQGRSLLNACGGHTSRPQIDFDGDGTTDIAVFRPSVGTWFILRSSDSALQAVQFGQSGDLPAAADFDGDGKSDVAVFRPSTGTWFILSSTDGFIGVQFGQNGDTPAAGDYDGDGKADVAVFRPSAGTWFILQSSNGQFRAQGWGISTDIPIQ